LRIKRTERDSVLLVGLTGLEYKVLEGLVRGESVKSLPVALSVSPERVLEARDALMEKLCAETTADLVRIGIVARAR
jgi:FixJ family two-component response regulator